MKYIFALVIFLSSTELTFSLDFQSTKLELSLKNLSDGVPFYLIREKGGRKVDTVEIAKSVNGNVIFKSRLNTTGERLFIFVDKTILGASVDRPNWISVFLESPSIQIKGDIKEWPVLTIEGARATIVYENYYNREDGPRVRRINKLLETMAKEQSRDSSELKALMAEYKSAAFNYFKKNLDVLSAPLLVAKSYPLSLEDKRQLFGEMKPEIQESFYGELLKKTITKLEREAVFRAEASNIRIGEPLPDFRMETPEGGSISIKELAAKSEYTLIDFWAYWCAPCRAAIPDLKKVYKKYHAKGFNIVGISTDPDRGKWLKALNELDTKWDNLLDVQGVSKPMFTITAIPAYVLINRNAEIVAMSIVGHKQNGASDKYFKTTEDIYLSGKTMNDIVGKLLGEN